jgi:hypothetical protein
MNYGKFIFFSAYYTAGQLRLSRPQNVVISDLPSSIIAEQGLGIFIISYMRVLFFSSKVA